MPRWALKEDMYAIRTLWQNRFGDSNAFLDYFFNERARPETTVVYEEDGCISSALQIPSVVVRIRGHAVPGAMLCGVSTAEKYERRGRMGSCLRFAMNALANTESAIIVQKPVDFRIYERFAFSPVSDAQYFTLSPTSWTASTSIPADIFETLYAGVLPQLQALYTRFCLPYSTSLIRDENAFTVKVHDYLCDGGHGILLHNEDGTLSAYAFYEPEDNCLHLREGGWRDYDAMCRLFAVLHTEAQLHDLGLSGRIPPDQKAPFPTSCTPTGAAAVGNTAALLRTVFNNPDFCVRVYGSICDNNNGIFDLSGNRVTRQPDFSIHAAQLIQIACGYRTLSELSANEVQIFNHMRAEAFDRRYPKQLCFSWDEY